jgi:hypothetical protein
MPVRSPSRAEPVTNIQGNRAVAVPLRAPPAGTARGRQSVRGQKETFPLQEEAAAMHISIRRYQQVRSVAEVCRKVTESFVPLLRRSPGFIAYYAIDAGGGTMATISIFSTEEMALESNEKALAWMKDNVAELQPSPAEITAGAVKVMITA